MEILDNLIFAQLFNKFPVFYETRSFIIALKSSSMGTVLSQLNPVHNLTTYSSKSHFKTIIPSTSRSPKRFPLTMYFDQNVVHMRDTRLAHPP
jgi:hypothetical protein